MRTVWTGLTVVGLSIGLFSGCEPTLDQNHPLAIARDAIDDVNYWNSVINEDSHRAAVKIMASIPELIVGLPSKVTRTKEQEASEIKKRDGSDNPVSADRKSLWASRWTEYQTTFDSLKGATKQKALSALVGAYPKSDSRDIIVDGLIRFGKDRGDGGNGVLIEAISDKSESESAQPAAAALLDGDITNAMSSKLIGVIGDATAPTENRYAALRIMAKVPVKAAIPALIKVVEGNPDIQPIALTELAAEALGKLGAPEAVDGLIRCLWLNDHLGRNAVKACRIALNKIGKSASLDKLIATLQRGNKAVEDRAKANRYDFGGTIEFKAAEMLGDMPDKKSVAPLIKAFKEWEKMPKAVAGHPTREPHFQKTRVQKIISLATALAIIGDEEAIPALIEMAKSERGIEVMNASIHQLAFLGSPKVIPEFMKILEEDTEKNEVAKHGFHYQVALAAARTFDPRDGKSTKALKKRVDDTVEQLNKWGDEFKEAFKKETDPTKRAGIAQNLVHFKGIAKLYDEVKVSIKKAEKCKYKAACWAKELPTRPTAESYRKGYRVARAVINTTKSCGGKKSCWKDHLPSRGSAESYVKVYKDLLKKVNGMERAVPGELSKEYGDRKFISDTAELCKADEKCWKEMLPSSAQVAEYSQQSEAIQKQVGSDAITASLKQDRYENAELIVSEVESCKSNFSSCIAKADKCTGEDAECRKQRADCGSVAACFSKELASSKNVKPMKEAFAALKIKAPDQLIGQELSRGQKRAKQIIETANACKDDGKCWADKMSTKEDVEPLLKLYELAQKKMSERKDKEGKPLSATKMQKAVERHVKRNHEEGKLIIEAGKKCKSDAACWQGVLAGEKRIKGFRDAYAESKEKAIHRVTVATLAQKFRDAELIAKTGKLCKEDKAPDECWSKQLGSTSRANKLIKAYETATVKSEDRATIQYLRKDFTNNAFYMVKTGKDCRDDVECWNTKVALRQQGWRMLAAYRLGQNKNKSKSLRELADYLGDADLIFRNVAMFSLRRLASKGDSKAVKALQAALKLDEERIKNKKGKYKGSIGAIKLALAQYE
ncbi:MAG: hypothetical protein CMH52_09745 [Myxococcales bacterium]|nr:hypothetical protein [Myxococcales bacterium]